MCVSLARHTLATPCRTTMLRIRVSNRYEQLAETLISALAGTRRSPIAAPLVIIPNAAVRSDLMQRLSRKTGIAANLRFEFLGRWLWMLLPDLVPGVAARPPFEIDELTWRCFDKLGKMAPASQPPVLQPYLRDADELRLIELAASAAQLIRNYGTHRPEWLSQWQAGKPVAALAGHAHEAWQAALWRTLSVELGMATEHPMVAYRRKLLAASQKELAQLHLPSQVSVFCVDELSDLALGMLDALARHVDVTLYTINPSEAYWFDTVSPRRLARLRALGKADHHESAHPLLTTLAPQTQVRLAKLLALDGEHVEDEFDVVSPRANDLLAAIQDSMLQLDDPPAGAWSGIDRTPLEIHACHSLTRELEVLHDRLLALFAARPGLRPEDVAVFVPDTDSAAPLIDAVFGTPRATPDLPYRIAGRKTIHADQATKALLLALDLGQRPWTVNAALDLLAEPIVHRRLGMDDVDLARLTDWLAASGAHAGLDVIDADPAHTGAHPTLTSALERLVLGFAVPDRATDPLDRISPVAGVEGSDAQLLASWARHLDTLEQISVLGRSRWPIERWQELISALAERTLSDAPEFAEDRLTLQTRLAAATGLLKRCLHDQIVGLAVIIHALK
ncbi:MAG TPA: exodeoxyribonuclease V subunit gamma, partial [Burkholderiaceae bacterium]|nr:exodeoxyribonuclease V subunit gamma [Burkholderiaceae bacterium]